MLPDGRAVPGLALVKGRHPRPGARYERAAGGAGDSLVTDPGDATGAAGRTR
ncbi:hypothetical protein OG520_15355 [Streptomyces sp. NBC_00984]|uniref:hypothetical protein n=1 Tax=Streptomyces sp. NBC_00984 TaxID=2903700 RepID=UPI00386BA87B|nr:hypothetical protein OG520_15355 [Streptomyces sp. NBC_00984]